MLGVLVQIAVLDIVFSLDSVITAVGMADQLWVMVPAVILAVGVMWFSPKRSVASWNSIPPSRCWPSAS